jgi:hypothetical protein
MIAFNFDQRHFAEFDPGFNIHTYIYFKLFRCGEWRISERLETLFTHSARPAFLNTNIALHNTNFYNSVIISKFSIQWRPWHVWVSQQQRGLNLQSSHCGDFAQSLHLINKYLNKMIDWAGLRYIAVWKLWKKTATFDCNASRYWAKMSCP